MKKLILLFAFFVLCSYASAQWWGDNDWDKTPLNDFGFYSQYINKYKYKNSHYSWDDKKFPWNYNDKNWNNILLPWGNVGIGTLRPDEKLHVVGNVLIEGMLFSTSLRADTLSIANLTVTNNILARKNILVDGNIGIGVTSPSQKLDIAGNLKVSKSIFSDSLITNGFRTGSGIFNSLRINENIYIVGKTGIGVPVPTEKLDIAGNLKVSNSIFADSIIAKGFRTGLGSFTNLNVSNNFNVSGNTGLGVPVPLEKLEVAGNIKTTQKLMAAEIIADTATFAKGVKINGNLVSSGNITSNTIYTNAIKLSGGQSIAIDNNISFSGSAIMDQTLAIGTTTVPAGYNVAVKGKIIAEEIKVRHFDTWPDYVFTPDYKLKSLYQVEAYIKQHQHLEGIVSAKQAETEGVEVGDMQAKLLEKIEQLTLYMIELKKENDRLAQKVASLEKQ